MTEEREPSHHRKLEEGIDYLVDHYAVLGVEQAATVEEIHNVFRSRIVLYHPDKYDHLAPEYQQRAAFQTRVLNAAYETLSNPVLRQTFDQLLVQWKGPISTTGMPVESLSWRNPIKLLNQPPEELREFEELLEQARSMSGHNPEMFAFIEEQFRASSNPSEALIKAYREALTKQDIMLGLEESLRRERVNLDPTIATASVPPLAYLEAVTEEIGAARQITQASVTHTILQIHSGEVKLLGQRGQAMTESILTDPNQAVALYTAQVLKRFDQETDEIKHLAARREAVMQTRLALVTGEYLTDPKQLTNKLLLGLSVDEVTQWVIVELNGNSADTQMPPKDMLDRLAVPNASEAFAKEGFSIIRVQHQDGLPLEAEFNAAAEKHFNAYLDAQDSK